MFWWCSRQSYTDLQCNSMQFHLVLLCSWGLLSGKQLYQIKKNLNCTCMNLGRLREHGTLGVNKGGYPKHVEYFLWWCTLLILMVPVIKALVFYKIVIYHKKCRLLLHCWMGYIWIGCQAIFYFKVEFYFNRLKFTTTFSQQEGS